MNEKWIALLGRRDQPADAVEEYCRFLAAALRERGIELQLERVAWDEAGWAEACRGLRKRAAGWRGNWVFMQYTALAWSARGFPLRVPGVVSILRESGAQVAVVYHDVEPYEGGRLIDKVRRLTQVRTTRRVMQLADKVVLTVPAEKISWLPGGAGHRAMFIPVGANLPLTSMATCSGSESSGRTVAVFGVTGGEAGLSEIREIAGAMRAAAPAIPGLRVVVLGRNSEAGEPALRDLLKDTGVQIEVLGMQPGEEVVRVLSQSDALLFVRSPISTRRGSAIAGIACGLPVIARAGSETAAPVTEAGIAFYAQGEKDEPGATLTRVLEDESYRALLAERSRRAYEEHFSWNAIASKFVRAFTQPE